jgi:hypothetical protein
MDQLQLQEATTFRPRGVYDGRKNLFSINQYIFHPAAEVGTLSLGAAVSHLVVSKFTLGQQDSNTSRPSKRIIVKLKAAGLIHMKYLPDKMY